MVGELLGVAASCGGARAVVEEEALVGAGGEGRWRQRVKRGRGSMWIFAISRKNTIRVRVQLAVVCLVACSRCVGSGT
jgi:hypothetical protein